MRFWDTQDGTRLYYKEAQHNAEDSLTAMACSSDNNFLLTGDTSGNLKMWDISEVDFRDKSLEKPFKVVWFIVAHKAIINSISVVESYGEPFFIVTASDDNNILLHRFDGIFIGQFGHGEGWNIHNMAPYEGRRLRKVKPPKKKRKKRVKIFEGEVSPGKSAK